VIRLSAPVDIALQRNRTREEFKDKSDAYLAYRHAKRNLPSFPNTQTIDLDTNRPIAETIESVRQIVWNSL
jgi:hypothetical protein